MSYVQNNLMDNEDVLFSARIHPAVFLPATFSFLLGLLLILYVSQNLSRPADAVQFLLFEWLGILFFLYSVLMSLKAFILLLTTEFAVTNKRVIAKSGFLRRNTIEILLSKVESVTVKQSILGRLLNFGTVKVTGTGGTHGTFKLVTAPLALRKVINQVVEEYTVSPAHLPI
jgi:uncharacterized membrane protein YdbT with pleckstrin-like domain